MLLPNYPQVFSSSSLPVDLHVTCVFADGHVNNTSLGDKGNLIEGFALRQRHNTDQATKRIVIHRWCPGWAEEDITGEEEITGTELACSHENVTSFHHHHHYYYLTFT